IPESRDSRSAISAWRFHKRSQSASNASRRDSGDRVLQSPSSNAWRAASTARRASRLDDFGTRATTSPVEGASESTVSPEDAPTNLPSMKSPYSRMLTPVSGGFYGMTLVRQLSGAGGTASLRSSSLLS